MRCSRAYPTPPGRVVGHLTGQFEPAIMFTSTTGIKDLPPPAIQVAG